MPGFRRIILWAILVLIVSLTVMAIAGAFAGAQRAQAFFNSVPAGVYWVCLGATLVIGIMVFPRLRRTPALLLIHAGCIMILAGAIWGSRTGHEMRHGRFGKDMVRRGDMAILEGTREDQVHLADCNDLARLPFALALDRFQIDYYQPGSLVVQVREGETLKVDTIPGRTLDLGPSLGRLEVLRTFEGFRVRIDPNGGKVYYDDPNSSSNPAVEVRIIRPNGMTDTQLVFERFPGHHQAEGGLTMAYRRMVKDYISHVRVIAAGRAVKDKDIEVNYPLRHGGYSFYQSSCGVDPETGKPYTILTVVCDRGLSAVYMGYAALWIGVTWQLWQIRLRLKAGHNTR